MIAMSEVFRIIVHLIHLMDDERTWMIMHLFEYLELDEAYEPSRKAFDLYVGPQLGPRNKYSCLKSRA